jgi:hypothetical protein
VTTCNEACEGNNNEICGGYWLISIYKLSGTNTTTALQTVEVATTPVPSPILLAGYEFVGCYIDSDTRVLSVWADGVNSRVSTMTNELCASQCVGYLYFGTEDCQTTLSVMLCNKADNLELTSAFVVMNSFLMQP